MDQNSEPKRLVLRFDDIIKEVENITKPEKCQHGFLCCKECNFNWPPQEKPHNTINHPRHYTTHPSGIECIEITRHMSFNLGNAVKYIWRADLKGNQIEDLKKARWYLDDEIKRLEGTPK